MHTRLFLLILAAPVVAYFVPTAAGQSLSSAEVIELGLIVPDELDEISGLVASRRHSGILWVHNDSGDRPRIFALDEEGREVARYLLRDAVACDWEDIAAGPGPEDGVPYLYVGDIGANSGCTDHVIYRLPEPEVGRPGAPIVDTLDVDAFEIHYPDGNRDAEALLVDPLDRLLYVVSKEGGTMTFFRATLPEDPTGVTLEPVYTHPIGSRIIFGLERRMITAGDIAPSGLALLVKSYDRIYCWRRSDGSRSFFDAPPDSTLPYIEEPQGEALGWDAEGQGYYTISEEPAALGIPALIRYYPLRPRE